MNDLSCGIRMWAQISFVLSQITRLRDVQTDGRTKGRTDGRTAGYRLPCAALGPACSSTVNAPSLLPDRVSGISCSLTSKPPRTLVFLGPNLIFLNFRQHAVSKHIITNIVLGHRSFVGGNIDSVLFVVLY